MNKKGLAGKLFLAVLVLALAYMGYVFYYRIAYVAFTFAVDNGEALDGEVYLSGRSVGKTTDGALVLKKDSLEKGEILFKARFENLTLDFSYKLPEEFEKYSEIPFSVSEKDFESQLAFARTKAEDKFALSPELHWRKMPIRYFVDIPYSAGAYKIARVRDAFLRVEQETAGVVHFEEVRNREDADIYLRGFYLTRENESFLLNTEDDLFTEGLAQYVFLDNIIIGANISFYTQIDPEEGQRAWGLGSCAEYPTTEVHEILHTLGLNHTASEKSILFPRKELKDTCAIKEIDKELVEKLREIYGSGK